MSLDVTLTVGFPVPSEHTGIFVREQGSARELTVAEARRRYPDIDLEAGHVSSTMVFEWNITHNLAPMAKQAGIYLSLWQPREIGIEYAHQLIERLQIGLGKLEGEPDYFRTFNPPNGWGNYENLVEFVRAYLAACVSYPGARVGAYR